MGGSNLGLTSLVGFSQSSLKKSFFPVDNYDKHFTKVLGTLELHNSIKV